jgi:hypothetical protein
MRDYIPIMMPNAATPMVGRHFPNRRGRHVGATLAVALLAVALNAHTHTHGANTTTRNSTITAQGDRKGRPYGADIITGDIT